MSIYEVHGKVDWKGRPATKTKHGGMGVAMLILGTFTFENMANLSIALNGVIYFSTVMHFSIADAANLLTNYLGTGYILSIIMAILADTYIGRFKTILISACIEFVGLGLLAIQSHYPKLKPPVCNIFDEKSQCTQLEGSNEALFYIGLYLMAIGTAGVKAGLPSHGADQFEDDDPMEIQQKSTFFNWFLLALCLGGAVSLTVLVYVEDNKGWDWGFAFSTLAMLLGILLLVFGLPWYRIHVVQGTSAITEIMQVYVAAVRNWKLSLPENSAELYEISEDKEVAAESDLLPHTDDFRFLDKAAIRSPMLEGENPNPWRLCSVTQVENAKIVVRMMPVFGCAIMMALTLAQLQTFSIQQGSTMNTKIRSFHIPPASIPIIPITFILIAIPLYDKLVVPLLRKFTGHPTGITYLQRIGIGLVLSIVSMSVAALVEVKRKDVARKHDMIDAIPGVQALPINLFWVSLQYFVFGIADMFTFVGLLEFFYSQAPQGLKSLSSCFLWASMAMGYFLSSILVKIVNKATKNSTRSGGWLAGNNLNRNHLNLFYWLLAIMCLLNFVIYLFVVKYYKYRPQKLERIGASKKVHEVLYLEKLGGEEVEQS